VLAMHLSCLADRLAAVDPRGPAVSAGRQSCTLAGYKRPKPITVVDSIPRKAGGKPDKNSLHANAEWHSQC
jgi:hypothetical protein